MKVFFATDIHGSRACWRKFLRCGEFYDADVLVLGGDMTGKGLVPIVREGDSYYTHLHHERYDLGESEVDAFRVRIREQGLYPFVVEADELAELQRNGDALDRLFRDEVLKAVERWVALADERLAASDVRCFVCPGNDDMFEIDEVLAASERLELAEGRVIELEGGFELVSTGWSNPTPWRTYREEPEEELRGRIASMTDSASAPPERLVFNLHCPPFDTPLDEAPALDDELNLVAAGRELKHVGSPSTATFTRAGESCDWAERWPSTLAAHTSRASSWVRSSSSTAARRSSTTS
jgi:Icc-related predicted phosphoesterase